MPLRKRLNWPGDYPVILAVDPGSNSGWARYIPCDENRKSVSYQLENSGIIYKLSTEKVADKLRSEFKINLILALEDQYIAKDHLDKIGQKVTRLVINRSRWQVIAELLCILVVEIKPESWQSKMLAINRGTKRELRKEIALGIAKSITGKSKMSADEADAICIGRYVVSELSSIYKGVFFRVTQTRK